LNPHESSNLLLVDVGAIYSFASEQFHNQRKIISHLRVHFFGTPFLFDSITISSLLSSEKNGKIYSILYEQVKLTTVILPKKSEKMLHSLMFCLNVLLIVAYLPRDNADFLFVLSDFCITSCLSISYSS
jgi:hypothetical protein